MLFLQFQAGNDRYALEARRVVEVAPLLALKQLPHAPRGVAGLFNFRGRPVPAVDLCELTVGRPSRERMSTRIIIITVTGQDGAEHLLGLIAEQATQILHKDSKDFVDPGVSVKDAPYLGPVLMDDAGAIQWIREQRLLPPDVSSALFSSVGEPANS